MQKRTMRWKRTLAASLLITGGVLASTPTPASAYCLHDMTRWDEAGPLTVAYPPDLFSSFNEQWAFIQGIGTWNANPRSTMKYDWEMTPDAHLRDLRVSRVDFSRLGWPSTPGMTWRGINDDGVTHGQAEIYLNTEWTYNLRGEFDRARRIADLRTVVVHEIGHTLGLNDQSPAACAPITAEEQPSVMNAEYIKKWIAQYDDGMGAAALYPQPAAPLAVPARSASAGGALDGYDFAATPRQAVGSGGNDVAFEATVVAVDAPRPVTPGVAGGRLTYHYRPVQVEITAAHRGSTIKAGETVTLRALGGSDRTGATSYADAVPESTWRTGARIVVLGRDPADLGDGVTAITPNSVLQIHDAEVRDPGGRTAPMTLPELRTELRR